MTGDLVVILFRGHETIEADETKMRTSIKSPKVECRLAPAGTPPLSASPSRPPLQRLYLQQ
jgi:hypothetical protein